MAGRHCLTSCLCQPSYSCPSASTAESPEHMDKQWLAVAVQYSERGFYHIFIFCYYNNTPEIISLSRKKKIYFGSVWNVPSLLGLCRGSSLCWECARDTMAQLRSKQRVRKRDRRAACPFKDMFFMAYALLKVLPCSSIARLRTKPLTQGL